MQYRSQALETADNSSYSKQQTVMLVDDSETDRATYIRYLQNSLESQYTFVEAETGSQALEVYEQHQPDIVLLDYLLPDLDGLEWLAQWQQQYSPICPVIVLTGQGDENIAVQFIKMGATDYLVKGQITAEKLKLSVEKAIALQKLRQDKNDLITKLKARNDMLRQSNRQYKKEIAKRERLKQIIDNVPVIIYAKEVDPQTKQSGKLWLVNQEFQKTFALTEADVIGKSDRDLFPPDVADSFAGNDLTVIESKQPLTTEERVYHSNGECHAYRSLKFPLFNDKQQITSIVGIAINITAEKQNKVKIQQSEARFRNTFEQAAMGIAHVATDGKWLKVNQKLCQIVGYTPEELSQKTFQDITHPEDLNSDLEYINRILAGEIATYSMEKRYIHQNKSYIWINLTVSLVKKSNGEPDYFISVIENISDRKSLELSLQKSLKRLSNLHKIDKAILAAKKPQEIAQTVIDNIQNFFKCQRASILTFDWEQQTATILGNQGIGKHLVDEGFQTGLDAWRDLIEQLQNQEKEQDREQNYIVACLSQSPSLSQAIKPLKTTKLDCFIVFPLKCKGDLLGVLQLWVNNPNEVTTDEGLTMVGEIS